MKSFACVVVMGLAVLTAASAPKKETSAAVTQMVKGNNQFAFDLYGQAAGQDGNAFLSPYSVSAALAMTYAGADGKTAAEMAKTLHFPADAASVPTSFGKLAALLNGVDGKKRPYELSTANALWAAKGYKFRPDFLTEVRSNYGAGLSELDFAGNTEKARLTINAWVESQTHDKIKDLIARGVLDGSTRLVLTNAIYFKGNWASAFDKKQTTKEPFHLTGGKEVEAELMHKTTEFGYSETADYQALELPYQGDDLTMVVMLPKKADGLAEFEKTLSSAMFDGVVGKMHKQKVVATLPKFKMEAKYELTPALKSLGMVEAFGSGADFSKMSTGEQLNISNVIHQSFVDVNEEGTEAAAATAVAIKALAIRVENPPPVFRADHPFVFAIRDARSGSVLFLGRLANPKS